jgi:hypothetical protein
VKCTCLEPQDLQAEPSICVLGRLRQTCPALRVYLPDNTWPDFERWHQQVDKIATHRSILLLALERGHLARLTSPVHRFLLDDREMRPQVQQQYVKDLSERWMHYADPTERHRKSRIFRGRVAELVCAEWLETLGWTILGLEALGSGCDVEARSREGATTAFEIKSIGTEDCDFQMILAAIAGEPAGGSVSPYTAINYLLFRIFEAARQLQAAHGRRIAVILVEDLTWWRFDVQLKNNWIDWHNPIFVRGDAEWSAFLESQKERYPGLPAVASAIRALDGVWIVRQSSGYDHDLEYDISMSSA